MHLHLMAGNRWDRNKRYEKKSGQQRKTISCLEFTIRMGHVGYRGNKKNFK